MLKDGFLTRFPKPDFAIALHDTPQLPAGTIGYTPGFALANFDTVDITIYGRGGHGSAPQNTIDPIVIAARMILAFQTIVARENDPRRSGGRHGRHDPRRHQVTTSSRTRSGSS